MTSRADENLDQTFDSLFSTLRSDQFLTRCGLERNELPFFISAFHASLQSKVDVLVPGLINRLRNEGVQVLHVDLYTLTFEELKQRGIWEKLVEREGSLPKTRFFETLQNVTDPKECIVRRISALIEAHPPQLILITGVGMVFPYLRSHRVLENIQTVTKQLPTVLFFPGDYTWVDGKGSYLKLFGILPDDRYYRAHNIASIRT